MSPDRQELFFGCVHAKKGDGDDEQRDLEYHELERIPITAATLDRISDIQERVRQLKHLLFKTPATAT